VWPDERVVRFVNENFLPARVHVKDDADAFQRYGEKYNAHWTPTVLQLDPNGDEQWRIEGFLPLEDFLGQLMLGRAHLDFKQGKWADAEKRFREILEKLPNTDAAPEALYWAGTATYKASHDPSALKETAKAFTTRYKDSSWAKKASIWA
jgi:hypothetical protein